LREHMQFEIKHLHQSLGITVVYVTHDQGEALTMSDRVAVFNDGRIQQLASPDELYERPQNSFVAQFIGENNKLNGVVEDIIEGRALVRLATGELIDATPVNVTTKGQKTLVSIRPERVEYRADLLPKDAHSIDAEVLEFIYMGDLFRTRLRVAGVDDFVIKSRNTAGQRVLKPGEKIKIGWAPADARALDPS
ncbi:MAG: ABC transporter ATP-binding protein, partial [Paracoccaceae bacterium]|nr:ABC transporter ATP-binding protein [Paracoccaceae bacterium]